MTIEQAIEILRYLKTSLPGTLRKDESDALNLGIEALKQIQASRTRPVPYNIAPLSGESLD